MGYEFDEDIGYDEDYSRTPNAKTPTSKTPGGITLILISTIGPGEKEQSVDAKMEDYIADIKQIAGDIFGLNPNDFHLSADGVTLDEGKTVSDYNMYDGQEVLLIPASTAGMK